VYGLVAIARKADRKQIDASLSLGIYASEDYFSCNYFQKKSKIYDHGTIRYKCRAVSLILDIYRRF